MNLKGKSVFVTGGSRGIGAATVKELAELGARVAFSYSSQKESAEAVLKSLPGEGHICVQMDVGSSESVEKACTEVLTTFGEVFGVVNNAGITKDQLILRMKEDDFEQVIKTNLLGTFYVTKFFSKHLLKNRKGSLVNISSVVGSMGNPGQSNYCASKAGVEGMTRSLALELASRGIRVNAVAPGYITSDMTKALNEDQLKFFSDRIPLGRAGDPKEVAAVVAFLLSEGAAYITGQTLHVNGGLYLN